jgi:hypothetical protein
MRTTLTLEKDVAVLLARLRREQKMTFKEIVNEALRLGLQRVTSSRKQHKTYVTHSLDLGRCLVGNLDDIAEVLAIVDGESYR